MILFYIWNHYIHYKKAVRIDKLIRQSRWTLKTCKTVAFYIAPKSVQKIMSQETLFIISTGLKINLTESIKCLYTEKYNYWWKKFYHIEEMVSYPIITDWRNKYC